MSFSLDALDARYRVILCDIWGVVHDGVRLYDGAAERLRQWEREGRRIVLLTNAPRTADAVERQLARLQLPRDCWHAICTSGEAGIAGLLALGEPVGFLGTPADRENLESREIAFVDQGFSHVAVTGTDGVRMAAEDYAKELEAYHARGVTLHCLNPDKLVIRGGIPEACAGAIADLYEAMGGRVEYYGKPHEHIYEHAFVLGGNPEKEEVLAIGDGLPTDVLGAAQFGIDCLFVQGGIHAGEPFPADFASQYGLGSWAPVAQVASLR
jgi:HAD superfamily hydrolase (TIGR01459 family)